MDKWISRSICIQIKRYEYKEIHNSDLGGGIEAGGWERRQQNEVASSESRGGSTERDQQRERGSRIGSAIPSGIDIAAAAVIIDFGEPSATVVTLISVESL